MIGVVRDALAFGRTRMGITLVGIVTLFALIGPHVAPYSPTEFIAPAFAPPGVAGHLGADELGRDVWSRFLSGGTTILLTAVGAALVGVGIGTAVGIVAAYFGSHIDGLLMRTADVFLAYPQLVLILAAIATLGRGPIVIAGVIAFSQAPRAARVVRGAALGIVNLDFVGAAEALGESRSRIMFGEILPNVTTAILVESGIRFTYSLYLVASLSFLGLGAQPPTPDWGLMIYENRIGLSIQPYAVLLPVMAIALLAIGTNLITDGLSRAAIGLGRSVSST